MMLAFWKHAVNDLLTSLWIYLTWVLIPLLSNCLSVLLLFGIFSWCSAAYCCFLYACFLYAVRHTVIVLERGACEEASPNEPGTVGWFWLTMLKRGGADGVSDAMLLSISPVQYAMYFQCRCSSRATQRRGQEKVPDPQGRSCHHLHYWLSWIRVIWDGFLLHILFGRKACRTPRRSSCAPSPQLWFHSFRAAKLG